ncbi:DUF881 domain-containing protein [Dermacoccus abyssi]|uniref:DUF881 domain-containing protein n=1 Tax=Dermacoccus abyssi TaxID=322596 RepID=A0ABX5ZBK2_9MICO|nr:DUF881 domain-containing protein [Dermacoccus abyssi]
MSKKQKKTPEAPDLDAPTEIDPAEASSEPAEDAALPGEKHVPEEGAKTSPSLATSAEQSDATPDDGHEAPAQPWRRYAFGGPRSLAGGLTAAVLALGLGFAVMTQVQQNEKSGLDNLSQADLVALLGNVNDQSARLEKELDDLTTSKEQLARGGDRAAVADAQKRLDQLAILNGTVQVKGPGIIIEVDSAGGDVTAANILDAVQELRDAGAESIDVGGNRIVASSWFTDVDGRPSVEGRSLPEKFTISAIGDPHTMSTAMAIPGGVTDTLTQAGARVKVSEETSMQITSLHRRD